MLKIKMGNCIDCPPSQKEVRLYAAGRCEYHYWLHRQEVNKKKAETRSEPTRVFFKPITTIELPDEEMSLTEWFQYQIKNNQPICDNCGARIYYSSLQIAISCQAHILPKAHFRSVKTHPLNHLVLCGMFQNNYCHSDFDSSWQKAEKMPVFALAKERFFLFKDLLTKYELGRLPEPFKKLI